VAAGLNKYSVNASLLLSHGEIGTFSEKSVQFARDSRDLGDCSGDFSIYFRGDSIDDFFQVRNGMLLPCSRYFPLLNNVIPGFVLAEFGSFSCKFVFFGLASCLTFKSLVWNQFLPKNFQHF